MSGGAVPDLSPLQRDLERRLADLGGALVAFSGGVDSGVVLAAAVRALGGPRAVLACGEPYTGPYQVPALAWLLGVHVGSVEVEPRAPGVVFRKRSATSPAGLPRPGDGFRWVAAVGAFDVLAACRAPSGRAARAPAAPVAAPRPGGTR